MFHFSKQDLDRIDTRSKLVVFGYIRDSQKEQALTIPDLVIYVILQCHGSVDAFNRTLCGEGITILADGKTITNKDNPRGLFTVYGTMVIDSMLDACYIWKFEQLGTETYCTNFGIAPDGGDLVDTAFYLSKQKAIYAYHCGGSNSVSGHSYSWQESERSGWPKFVNFGDILTMKLEFKEDEEGGSLSFQINDDKEFVVFRDAVLREKGLSYRLAVCNNTSHQVMKIRML